MNGLSLMNKRTSRFTRFTNNPKDTNSLTKNMVVALDVEKSGNVWVGIFNAGGLDYFDRKTGVFKHYLKGMSITFLFRDSYGTLWVGTDDGLFRSNNSKNGFTKFTDPGSGIENTLIRCIQEDDQRNIWVSTTKGIYRINTRNQQSTQFGSNYGVSGRAFNYLAAYKGVQGDIYFGDQNGYYVINPGSLITNPNPPQVALTDFRISGKSVMPGKDGPLTEPLESVKNISLRYDQNVLAFDFAAIHYSSPEQNRHLYKLENFDPDWREGGSENTAFYYNVPPGRYTFRIKAASSEGVWAEKAISIVIHPPWWRTWWAYVLYGLLFLAGAYLIHRYQKQRIIAAERERNRVRELAQAKKLKKHIMN
ncbi:MAG: triple tyrosine motif-containing protein [Nocardioidaceae bacterium]